MRNCLGLRVAAVLVMISLMLNGCAANRGGTGDNEVATGGKRFGTADAETAKLGSDAAPGVFPRKVKHANGETEIPKKPERILVLDTGELDVVLSLGLTAVGMTTTEGAKAVPTYLADRVAGIPTVGTLNEIDLEAIVRLKPDLILGSKLRADKLYSQLSEIANTVFSIRPGFPWKENALLIGDALGMENETAALLNKYADDVAQLKAKFPNPPTISLVRFMPNRLRLYGNKSLIGVILKDAGFPRPPKQNVEDLAVQISPENIDTADGGWIFYSSYGQPDATGESQVIQGAGWKSIPAVKQGRLTRVDDDTWFLGLGPIGAGIVVSQLGEYLKGA